jgi:8-oxo-dGTP pyrophosphatase MutT (NUDIX family)
MIDHFEFQESETLLETNIFQILQKKYIKEDKSSFKAILLDTPDWVNIIGINDDDQILLLKQYRFGTESIELEIPGGIIEDGETPEEAAIRELKEETGFYAKKLKKLGDVNANPAFMNNKVYSYLAYLSDKGSLELDDDEIIFDIHLASPKQVLRYLKQGKITNAYCVLAFFWLKLFTEIL